jgi:hypothetical protein
VDIHNFESVVEDMCQADGNRLIDDILETLLNVLPNRSALITVVGTVAILGAMLCTVSKLIRLQYQNYHGNRQMFYNQRNKESIPQYHRDVNESETDLKHTTKNR